MSNEFLLFSFQNQISNIWILWQHEIHCFIINPVFTNTHSCIQHLIISYFINITLWSGIWENAQGDTSAGWFIQRIQISLWSLLWVWWFILNGFCFGDIWDKLDFLVENVTVVTKQRNEAEHQTSERFFNRNESLCDLLQFSKNKQDIYIYLLDIQFVNLYIFCLLKLS